MVPTILLISLAGCTSPEPSAQVGASPTGVPSNQAACDIATANVGEAVGTPELTITAVRQVKLSGTSSDIHPITLHDAPVKPAIAWDKAANVDPAAVLTNLAATGTEVGTQDSPPATRVDPMLAGLQGGDGTYIGYASVNAVKHVVNVACGDGRTLRGVLATWNDSEIGVVRCGLTPPDAPPAAVKTQNEFCK